MIKIIIAIVVAAVLVIGGYFVLEPIVSGTDAETIDGELSSSNSYSIEGEVSRPGTYTLADNVTMADLISAAGGTTYNADDLAYFEDAIISSGVTYYIASKYDANDICNNKEIEKVNINSANSDDLSEVNGISSTVANSIVSYRVSNGTFRTLEDVLNVYGIGNATYKKIRNYIILHE